MFSFELESWKKLNIELVYVELCGGRCGFAERELERDKGRKSVRDQISLRWQRRRSVFGCDSLRAQMATSSSCLRRYSSMKIIIRVVHGAQRKIWMHSSLISRKVGICPIHTMHINPSGGESLRGVISQGMVFGGAKGGPTSASHIHPARPKQATVEVLMMGCWKR